MKKKDELRKLYYEAIGIEDDNEAYNPDEDPSTLPGNLESYSPSGEDEEEFDPNDDGNYKTEVWDDEEVGDPDDDEYDQDAEDQAGYDTDTNSTIDNIINMVSEIKDNGMLIQIEAYVEKITGKDVNLSVDGL